MVVKQKMDYPGGNTGDFKMRQFALGNLLCKQQAETLQNDRTI